MILNHTQNYAFKILSPNKRLLGGKKKKKTEEQLTSFGCRPMENINIRIRNILRSEVGY